MRLRCNLNRGGELGDLEIRIYEAECKFITMLDTLATKKGVPPVYAQTIRCVKRAATALFTLGGNTGIKMPMEFSDAVEYHHEFFGHAAADVSVQHDVDPGASIDDHDEEAAPVISKADTAVRKKAAAVVQERRREAKVMHTSANTRLKAMASKYAADLATFSATARSTAWAKMTTEDKLATVVVSRKELYQKKVANPCPVKYCKSAGLAAFQGMITFPKTSVLNSLKTKKRATVTQVSCKLCRVHAHEYKALDQELDCFAWTRWDCKASMKASQHCNECNA